MKIERIRNTNGTLNEPVKHGRTTMRKEKQCQSSNGVEYSMFESYFVTPQSALIRKLGFIHYFLRRITTCSRSCLKVLSILTLLILMTCSVIIVYQTASSTSRKLVRSKISCLETKKTKINEYLFTF